MLLSPRQKAFVAAYLGPANGNATTAAKLAGYSRKTARQLGHRLLTNVDIRAAIERTQTARVDKAIADADERDRLLTEAARDSGAEWSDRIRAIIELNRCSGRHSLHLIHKGKMTVAEALGLSRSPDLDEEPDGVPLRPA